MADRDAPETSTVREALAIVANADTLRSSRVLSGEEFVDTLDDLMERARALRPHQVADVVAHLRDRYGAEPEPSFHGMPGDVPPTERRVADRPQA